MAFIFNVVKVLPCHMGLVFFGHVSPPEKSWIKPCLCDLFSGDTKIAEIEVDGSMHFDGPYPRKYDTVSSLSAAVLELDLDALVGSRLVYREPREPRPKERRRRRD